MSASCVWAVFPIALLIDCPTDSGGDPIGDPSDCLNYHHDTRDPDALDGVVACSSSESDTPRAATLAYEVDGPTNKEDCSDP